MAKFVANERILAFHGPLIYEAKVQKVDGAKYFIHYHGWNKNWDEWVPEARILKYTESNLDKKRQLVKAHEANVKAKRQVAAVAATKRKATEPTPSGSGTTTPAPPAAAAAADVPPPKAAKPAEETPDNDLNLPDVCLTAKSVGKSKEIAVSTKSSSSSTSGSVCVDNPPLDNTVETEDQFYTKVEIRIKVPDELKPYLVDDWDYLTRQRKLVLLPARLTVDQIIQDYIKYKSGSAKRNGNGRENAVQEVTSGLKEYFNVMLGSQLLYKFEREQHSDFIKKMPDVPMCNVS